jgi:hypothetical protein
MPPLDHTALQSFNDVPERLWIDSAGAFHRDERRGIAQRGLPNAGLSFHEFVRLDRWSFGALS